LLRDESRLLGDERLHGIVEPQLFLWPLR